MADNGFIVIDTTRLVTERIDEFVDQWRNRAEIVSEAPGFRSARLLRAEAPETSIPLVMVAEWDSRAARDSALTDPGFRASATSSGDYAEVTGGEYTVADEYHSDTTPAGPGALFVNAFELPPARFVEFLEHWRGRAQHMVRAPGFRSNRLHRALDADTRFQAVNIAYWDSAQAWRTAGENPLFRQRLAAAPQFFVAHPAVYRVAAEFVAD